MFGVSFPELLLVMLVVLLVYGPDKLPEVANKLGRIMAEFRKHSDSLRREFYNSVYKPLDDAKVRFDPRRELTAFKNEFEKDLKDELNPHAPVEVFMPKPAPVSESPVDPEKKETNDEPATEPNKQ